MGTRINMTICHKDSSAVNSRSFEITTLEETRKVTNEIFEEHDKVFGRYFYEAEADQPLTPEEQAILDELDIEII